MSAPTDTVRPDSALRETLADLAADSGRIEVRLAICEWLRPHVWWHYGCRLGLGISGLWMNWEAPSQTASVVFWIVWVAWSLRSDVERVRLLDIASGRDRDRS